MIRYEVNLQLDEEIIDNYMEWLRLHIDKMLSFKGFIKAELFEDTETKNQFIVHYDIETEADMESYLENHAKKMREEANTLFAGKFSASRRILKISNL